MKKTCPEATWRERLTRFGQSGLSVGEYCRRNSLQTHQLIYWRDRIKVLDQKQGRFVQVSERSDPVEIHVGDRIKILVTANYDGALVKSLVELLSNAKG